METGSRSEARTRARRKAYNHAHTTPDRICYASFSQWPSET